MKIDFRTPEAKDGSIKYRFRTHDDQWIEALYFPYHNGLKVLCLSTQIGCDMACYFCCTGKQKRVRNLTLEEIVQQATLIVDDLMPGKAPDTITLAGMGEPLANFDASIGALKQFREMYGNIRLSLSTVGLKEGIQRMINDKCTVGLYLSLHSSDEEIRKKLMPAASRNVLPELMDRVREYARMNAPGTVRISYLLLKGMTDSQDQLHKLIDLCRNGSFQVQFRIWNHVDGIDLEGSPLSVAEEWVARLQEEGINACVRPSVGQEVQGACGQIHCCAHKQKIIPITSFSEAEHIIDTMDQTTLVVFDIDSTLIVPEDPLLHPKVFSSYKDVIRKLFDSITPDQKHFLNHSIIAHDSMAVEKSCVELINKLQARKIPVIAMTAAKQGRFDEGEKKFHEIRIAQLKKLGIDFSKSTYSDRKFSTLQATYGDYPCLIQGISYSCGLHNSKGSVLEAFLKEISGIERVILFDDKKKHLESCAAMLKEKFPDKEFLGFQYKGADLLTPEVMVSKEEFEENLLSLAGKVKQIEWIH
jgi:23S rRNA (adenine2503-C2)-methyltransferase